MKFFLIIVRFKDDNFLKPFFLEKEKREKEFGWHSGNYSGIFENESMMIRRDSYALISDSIVIFYSDISMIEEKEDKIFFLNYKKETIARFPLKNIKEIILENKKEEIQKIFSK